MTNRSRARLGRTAAIAFGLAVAVSGCAKKAPQTTLKPKGPRAELINNLINPVFMIAAVVFVLIMGGALYVSWKFRARDDDDYDAFPEQIHGDFKMEIGWTIGPAIILAVVGVFTVIGILDLSRAPDKKTALQVEVIGQQWWWEYRYDTDNDGVFDDIVTANDLVVPAGRDISLHIKSRDVIHSWWAPALNGKKDAVPGRDHPWAIKADKPGEYIGQCTEYCGLSHAEMRIKVVALSPAKFADWQANQEQDFKNPSGTTAQAGWTQFVSQCTTCHRITGMTDPGSSPDDPTKATKVFKYPPTPNAKDNPQSAAKNQVSGAAPNLTHLMSRSLFAGGKFNLRKPTKECVALGEDWAQTSEGLKKCLNRKDLEAWLRNPPAEKAMDPGDAPNLKSRGMPNFNLSENQIDELVAFLTTLK